MLPAPSTALSPSPQEAYCGYSIIIMALFWCTEALPLAVTALFPLVLLPMMGIMEASEVSPPQIHTGRSSRGSGIEGHLPYNVSEP